MHIYIDVYIYIYTSIYIYISISISTWEQLTFATGDICTSESEMREFHGAELGVMHSPSLKCSRSCLGVYYWAV
jgi:hypothetical protein